MSPRLEVEGIAVCFGSEQIFEGISLSCDPEEIVSIVGPSGCGKTTFLRAVAGLIPVSAGRVAMGGLDIKGPSRRRGLVFQDYCVFPWLTVEQNIRLGSECGLSRTRRGVRAEVEDLLLATGLSEHRQKYPAQLSGGMRQRVAIARTLAADPELLLLDEPFGSLDFGTRLRMQDLVAAIFRETKQAILLVTHDIREAVVLSDRILLLSKPLSAEDGENPTTLVAQWSVPDPRSGADPFKLSGAQDAVAGEILERLEACER